MTSEQFSRVIGDWLADIMKYPDDWRFLWSHDRRNHNMLRANTLTDMARHCTPTDIRYRWRRCEFTQALLIFLYLEQYWYDGASLEGVRCIKFCKRKLEEFPP